MPRERSQRRAREAQKGLGQQVTSEKFAWWGKKVFVWLGESL